MLNTILKVIEYLCQLFIRRKGATNTQANEFNKQMQREKEKHLQIIENAHELKDLEEIRKKAAE
jgi:hypothetical protein